MTRLKALLKKADKAAVIAMTQRELEKKFKRIV